MKNYVQPGNVIDIVAAAVLTSGTAVVFGNSLAIPVSDAAIGDTIAAHIEGVFELPKLSTAVYTAGQSLRWDVSTAQFSTATAATGDLEGCAIAVAAAGNGTATVMAKLLPGNASVTA
jgi:predicted RecA/RadA family phage recombinase